jgi:S-DNA-T family DNA segregation ATPase FtsK/SpoIIIE
LLDQARADGVAVKVAAPPGSPLAAAAGATVFAPNAAPPESLVPSDIPVLLLVDDCEAFLDTAMGDALTALVRAAPPGLTVVAAGRTDELAVNYRGVGAEVRRARCAVLLQPSPGDGELVGLRLPVPRSLQPPGRGLLLGDPAWGPVCAAGPVAVQLAQP